MYTKQCETCLRTKVHTKIPVHAGRNLCEKLAVGVLQSCQPASESGHLQVSQVSLTYTGTFAPTEVSVCGLCITGARTEPFPHMAQAAGADICKSPPPPWRSLNLAHQPHPTWSRHIHLRSWQVGRTTNAYQLHRRLDRAVNTHASVLQPGQRFARSGGR